MSEGKMQLKMDRDALAAFLKQDFAEVADDFVVDRADMAGVALRMRVADRH